MACPGEQLAGVLPGVAAEPEPVSEALGGRRPPSIRPIDRGHGASRSSLGGMGVARDVITRSLASVRDGGRFKTEVVTPRSSFCGAPACYRYVSPPSTETEGPVSTTSRERPAVTGFSRRDQFFGVIGRLVLSFGLNQGEWMRLTSMLRAATYCNLRKADGGHVCEG